MNLQKKFPTTSNQPKGAISERKCPDPCNKENVFFRMSRDVFSFSCFHKGAAFAVQEQMTMKSFRVPHRQ